MSATCPNGVATSPRICARASRDPRPVGSRCCWSNSRATSRHFTTAPDVLGFAVPLELESRDGHLRLITTLTSFATATDITLAELELEAFLPADEATADVLRKRAEQW